MIQQPFGRPVDHVYEKMFMEKIRGDKTQAIQSLCELEAYLKFDEQFRCSREQSEINTLEMIQKIGQLQFQGLSNNDKIAMTEKFQTFKDEWVAQELQKNQPLPEYLFDDSCDLSYILHRIQSENQWVRNKFSSGQLLFLQILSLGWKKQLNTRILKYIEINSHYMQSAMELGLKKINDKIEHLRQQKQKKLMEKQVKNNQQINFLEDQPQKSESSEEERPKKKQKKIRKSKKTKPKKVKKKQTSSEEQQQSQEEYPEGKELALRIVDYVCWAYWYIIDKKISDL